MVVHTTNVFFTVFQCMFIGVVCLSRKNVSATGDGIPRSYMKCKESVWRVETDFPHHSNRNEVSRRVETESSQGRQDEVSPFSTFYFVFMTVSFLGFHKEEGNNVNRVFRRLLFVIRFSNMM